MKKRNKAQETSTLRGCPQHGRECRCTPAYSESGAVYKEQHLLQTRSGRWDNADDVLDFDL